MRLEIVKYQRFSHFSGGKDVMIPAESTNHGNYDVSNFTVMLVNREDVDFSTVTMEYDNSETGGSYRSFYEPDLEEILVVLANAAARGIVFHGDWTQVSDYEGDWGVSGHRFYSDGKHVYAWPGNSDAQGYLMWSKPGTEEWEKETGELVTFLKEFRRVRALLDTR